MSLTEIREFEDHAATLDPTMFLGHVVFFTVHDLQVKYDIVKRHLESVGLGDILPTKPPSDIDVFRRVFQNGQRRQYKNGVNVENVLVRDVVKTSERLVKRIVIETVDQEGERLNYVEAVEVEWNKNHPDALRIDHVLDIDVTEDFMLQPVRHPHASNLANELAQGYIDERGCLDGNAVRAIIHRALDRCCATSLRGKAGGVFFVSQTHDDELESMEKMVGLIDGAEIHSLPLLDDRKQRDMVRASFVAEVTTDADRLIIEMREALKDGTEISPRKFASFSSQHSQLKKKMQEYRGILEDDATLADVRMEMLNKAMADAFMQVA